MTVVFKEEMVVLERPMCLAYWPFGVRERGDTGLIHVDRITKHETASNHRNEETGRLLTYIVVGAGDVEDRNS